MSQNTAEALFWLICIIVSIAIIICIAALCPPYERIGEVLNKSDEEEIK